MTMQIDPSAFQAVIEDMHQRLGRAHQDYQRVLHEAEALRARPVAEKIWPVQVRCDTRRCPSVVAFDPAPQEDRLALALAALGWSGHVCPRCAR